MPKKKAPGKRPSDLARNLDTLINHRNPAQPDLRAQRARHPRDVDAEVAAQLPTPRRSGVLEQSGVDPREPNEPWEPLWRGQAYQRGSDAPAQLAPGVETWGNNLYSVTVYRRPGGRVVIGYRRRDRLAINDWRHEQQIKNTFVGEEGWGVMVYPPESQLVDESNERWMLLGTDECPFSLFGERSVRGPADVAGTGAAQRPFQPGTIPPEIE